MIKRIVILLTITFSISLARAEDQFLTPAEDPKAFHFHWQNKEESEDVSANWHIVSRSPDKNWKLVQINYSVKGIQKDGGHFETEYYLGQALLLHTQENVESFLKWKSDPDEVGGLSPIPSALVTKCVWTTDSKYCVFLWTSEHGRFVKLSVWPTNNHFPKTMVAGYASNFTLEANRNIKLTNDDSDDLTPPQNLKSEYTIDEILANGF